MVKTPKKRDIDQYDHRDKERLNNPPVGLVDADTEPEEGRKTYQYDPHLDPRLEWAGKAEHTSFDVPTVSLHVHERIDPKTILRAAQKDKTQPVQLSLFDNDTENPPLRQALDFYKHKHGWSNRLIAGDSLLVMNSLLEKEAMAGQVQMVYFDPPYGIKYGSNFQPFVNKRSATDGKDDDLTSEPETVKAFRDTWELGIHSYLAHIRDRMRLARELLADSGSVFVQISDDNLHHVKEILDEVFGPRNFVSIITFKKTSGTGSPSEVLSLSAVSDYLVWYAKDKDQLKFRRLFRQQTITPGDVGYYHWVEEPNGTRRKMTAAERDSPSSLPKGARIFALSDLTSQTGVDKTRFPVYIDGKEFRPAGSRGWATHEQGMRVLQKANRIMPAGNNLRFVRYLEDYPIQPFTNLWEDTGIAGFGEKKVYVVQTNVKVVERCILLTSDPGDLVLDITCGSGTTALCAEKWGRRWITCDSSRIAVTLAKQRLMTASFDYFELARPNEGVSGGFNYETAPHVRLRDLANSEPSQAETLYDRPKTAKDKIRVTGPLTIEAVPSPTVMPLEAVELSTEGSDLARTGETGRQVEWRDELARTGIRATKGEVIQFSRLETLAGGRYLHVEGETKGDKPQRVVVSFGPEHGPLVTTHVERAYEEARTLKPKPDVLAFAAFQFDPEAQKDIDDMKEQAGMKFLRVQINTDLLTDDLKKKRSSNESFFLMGQPDVEVKNAEKGMFQVEVHGFDYFDVKTGDLVGGGKSKIAMWMLDPDYDGRSLFPKQVFFPLGGKDEGWGKLAKILQAEIDEERIEAYRGTVSLPFRAGERIAVKIVDDRGIESLKVITVG